MSKTDATPDLVTVETATISLTFPDEFDTSGSWGRKTEHDKGGWINDAERYIALALGARCGLRSEETIRVTPEHVVDTDAGLMLWVQGAKAGGYRETPIPDGLATRISTAADMRDEPADAPLIDVSKRTIRRWVEQGRDALRAKTGDGY